MRWAGYTTYGRISNAYNILIGKLERKRPLGRHRCICEEKIKHLLIK
jgi:hypothetical protein